ncbi:MAG: hypothetical protein UT32_C0021G0006 [Parcubacteria group bacterium GW2011_GWC2_39_14]|nr:MAG: hypothetical protein UT32_C0021G0006 [Parcubacteria group bacterium GW2011_GWC2_39_14]KKR53939.1 MAG: hypothetical protein UT91_C0022G0006 [Parcubacteria group bacterium GW2011_GWA2_40_23]
MEIRRRIGILLKARSVGEYSSGHMGAQILRFRRIDDDSPLVVKFTPYHDASAIVHLEDNIHGYHEIRSLGGSELLPMELQEILLSEGRALVMRDLGYSMRHIDGGIQACDLFWQYLRRVIGQTAVLSGTSGFQTPPFVQEVTRHIERFSHGAVPQILRMMRSSQWTGTCGKVAIMLLDFTPNNLFADESGLHFIDPWSQKTYLGHPSVSIGQFTTLMQLGGMKEAEAATLMIKKRCWEDLPAILGCDFLSIEQAFRLGATLQLVLSSYVRQESEPARAERYLTSALNLWC